MEISQFQVRPLGIPLAEITNFIEAMYGLLDESLVKSNNTPQEVFEKTEHDYERHYLAITFEDKIYGLACLGYD